MERAHALTRTLKQRLPHRAFNSANRQRGILDIPAVAADEVGLIFLKENGARDGT